MYASSLLLGTLEQAFCNLAVLALEAEEVAESGHCVASLRALNLADTGIHLFSMFT